MKTHYGQIVEYTIRKEGYSITELARLSNVNRRSVYNWFNQKNLKADIIYRLGLVIKHDFSKEFPELFEKAEFNGINALKETKELQFDDEGGEANRLWKERYITLLESYNRFLQLYSQNKLLSEEVMVEPY